MTVNQYGMRVWYDDSEPVWYVLDNDEQDKECKFTVKCDGY